MIRIPIKQPVIIMESKVFFFVAHITWKLHAHDTWKRVPKISSQMVVW